jgi:hypothetical protein
MRSSSLDFEGINRAALGALPVLLARWLPNGRRHGHRWHARNPTRDDRHLGSFSIDIRTGRWADFATGDTGADVINLYAYLRNIGQGDAARELASLLGISR